MKDCSDDILVSVCVVTYNQESYIAECLESLIKQKADFKFEIIVGEDCSTDNTRAIVEKYIEKYPNLIVPLFYEKNVGAAENIRRVYDKAKGKYIAHMDGDDIAMPNKLQKQFDVLESNPQVIICSHDVACVSFSNQIKKSPWHHPEGQYGFLDLVKKLPFFAHSSKFFRVRDDVNLSSMLCDNDVLDIELHLYQLQKGTLFHLGEDLGIYRVGVGISAIKDNKLNTKMIERVMKVYERLLNSHPVFESDIKKSYSMYLLNTAYSYGVFESDAAKMRYLTTKSIRTSFFSYKQIVMLILSAIPAVSIPTLKFRSKNKNRGYS